MTAQLPLRMVEHQMTSLRRLAHQLLGDPHAAEDALQETWLRALRSPPSSLDRLRHWLETVLRNVVRQQHRQTERTRRREQIAAGSESFSPSAAEAVMRQQNLRALTEAILSLPPELQECVFLRYFEGLAPRQIAQRTGRPARVVYRDLERTKRRLRRQLEDRHADWQQGLAVLVGLRPMAASSAIGGMIILTKKTLVVLGITLALFLGYAFSPWLDTAREDGLTDPQASGWRAQDGTAQPAERLDGIVDEPPEHRSAIGEMAAIAPSKLAPYEFEMTITARTVEDLPGAGVPILLAPARHELNQTTTDKYGVAQVKWRGRVPTMTMVYSSPRGLAKGGQLRQCEVHAGVVARVVLRVRTATPLRGPFVVYEGRADKSVPGGLRRTGPGVRFTTGLVTGDEIQLHTDSDGWSWFTSWHGEQRVVGASSLPSGSYLLSIAAQLEGRLLAVRPVALPVLELPAEPSERRRRRLTGTVVDASGRPAARALILVAGRWRTRTDRRGRYSLTIAARDTERLTARAGGGDHGLSEQDILVLESTELSWHPRLDRGLELQGRLLTADGEPLGGWRIEIESVDGSAWVDGTETTKRGGFSIPNVIDRAYRLSAYAPGAALASFHIDALRPGISHVLAVRTTAAPGWFRMTPRTLDDQPVAGAEVRLWDATTGQGQRFRLRAAKSTTATPRKATPKKSAFVEMARSVRLDASKSAVPAGQYRSVVGAPGFAWQDHGWLRIDAQKTSDLREVILGESTTLEVRGMSQGLRLYRLHTAVPSRIETAKQQTLRLPPGNYHGLDADQELDFTIQPGENVLPESLLGGR